MDMDIATGRCVDAKNMEQPKSHKRKRKYNKGNENLGENIELCGIGEQKSTVSDILEVKEMGISNSGLQDTLLGVDLTVQSPIPKPHKKKKKSRKGKENIGETMKLSGFGEQKQAVSELLEAKAMEIKTNSGLQNTLLDVGLTAQSPMQKHIMDTTTDLEENKENKKKKRGKKKKPEKGNVNLGENNESCGFEVQKQTVSEISEVKEMENSNSGLQDALPDVDLTEQSPIQKHFIDTTTNLEEPKKRMRGKRCRKGKDNLGENKELRLGDQKLTASEVLEVTEVEIPNNAQREPLLDVDSTVQSPIQKHLIDTTTNLEEPKKRMRGKRRRKGKDNLGENKELCGLGDKKQTASEVLEVTEVEIPNNAQREPLLDVDSTVQSPIQKHLIDATTNLEECKKRTKGKKRRKGKEYLGEKKELRGLGDQKQTASEVFEVTEVEIPNNAQREPLLDVDSTVQSPIQKHLIDTTTNLDGSKNKEKKKIRRKKPKTQCGESLQNLDHTKAVSALNLFDKPLNVDRKICNLQGRNQDFRSSASESARDFVKSDDRQINERVAADGNMNNFLNVSHHTPERTPVAGLRKKLLILDVNGLLADVVFPAPKKPKADVYIFGRAVFMRPFCSDFLRFCFERFDVGIWSSRSKNVLLRIVDYILGDLKRKLLLFWDTSHCTKTNFKTLENNHKFIVFKELRKIWEKSDPNVPWEKGDYNESNTLLLDDSPYKALLNPAHTGIFPLSYSFMDKNDNSLGPGGDLRLYLEGLACADNCAEYVKTHPFGQSGLDESCSDWDFYSNILRRHSNL